MEETWNVLYHDRPVGVCTMERQGLYWRIICRCSTGIDGICRLIINCGGDDVDLGVLVPLNGSFGLEKRIPVKRLPEGEPRLFIRNDADLSEVFVPVRSGESFSLLSRLEGSRYVRRNGEAGVLITNV